MKSGIYSIRNTVNGKLYVGSAVGISKRWFEHKRLLRKNQHQNPYLQNSWNKYGEDCFEFSVLEECEKDELLIREQVQLDAVRIRNLDGTLGEIDHNLAYNTCPIAGSQLGMRRSEESKKKMSNAQKGKYVGEKNPMYGVRLFGEQNHFFGKCHTEETREKMRLAWENRVISQETKERMSEAKSGEKHPNAKLTWKMVREIREKYATDDYTLLILKNEYNVSIGTISYIINNKTWKEK